MKLSKKVTFFVLCQLFSCFSHADDLVIRAPRPDGSIPLGDTALVDNFCVSVRECLEEQEDIIVQSLEVGSTSLIHGDLGVEGSLSVQGNTALDSNLFVGGQTDLQEVQVHGDTSFADDVVFHDDVSMHGNLRVHGDVKIDDDLKVKDDLTVSGKTKTESLEVECQASVGCDLVVTHDISVGNNLYVTNDAVINNDLTVNGNLNANIVINSITTACGSTLDCDLFVVDDATIGDALDVGCDLSVGCNILMNNSTDLAHGNVLKNGFLFLHNLGTNNTFLGISSGSSIGGEGNTGVGAFALANHGIGDDNTAMGRDALGTNVFGSQNVAIGSAALRIIDGFPPFTPEPADNVAVGAGALQNLINAAQNVAVGSVAGAQITSTSRNTALGFAAMGMGTKGGGGGINPNPLPGSAVITANVAVGALSLNEIGSGDFNTALGTYSGRLITTGTQNTALGVSALENLSTGSFNIAIGTNAGTNLTTESNNIDIGNLGVVADSGVIRIGTAGTQTATFIAGIRGTVTGVADAIPVLIDSTGQLGTVSSSERFKKNIVTLDSAEILSRLLQLVPVSFAYKADQSETKQFGLIAEKVAPIFPELIIKDADGNILTVKYMEIISLLLAAVKELNQNLVEESAQNKIAIKRIEKLEQELSMIKKRKA